MKSKPAILWHHFANLDQQHGANVLGMILFLSTEFLLFGSLLTGYTVYRTSYPEAFEDGSRHLNVLIGTINTLVLLGSSLTMALAVRAGQLDDQRGLLRNLGLTMALALTFLGFKAFEYYRDYEDLLVPGLAFSPGEWRDPAQVQLFLTFYYVLTGIHALHMVIGLLGMLVLFLMAWNGRIPAGYATPVESWGLYWHFVDIVWIFLLPLLYLIGTRAVADLHF